MNVLHLGHTLIDGDLDKVAFWRRLRPEHEGHDEAGNEVAGKTWVAGKMRPGIVPKPHQLDALRVTGGLQPGGGVVLAHGTGTGKTPTAVMAVEQKRDQLGGRVRALILTPAGLRNNFATNGVEKFTTGSSQIVKTPKEIDGKTDYVIASYEAFRRRPQEFVSAVKPDIMVADEFHRATNPRSQTNRAIQSVRGQIPEFIGMTASIAQNDPSDVAPLLALARGEEVSQKSFRRRHVTRQDAGVKGIFGGRVTRPVLRDEDALSNFVGKSVHYVEDLDASEKPRKDASTVEVPMSKEQMAAYKMTLSGLDPKLVDKMMFGGFLTGTERKNLLTRIMLARKASNSLHTVTNMSVEDAAEKTPKVKQLLTDVAEHLENTPDGQVIVYTNFVKGGVDVVTAGLKKLGIPYGVFAGRGVEGMTEQARQRAVTDYQEGKNRVIVITGAGAEGLSLGNTTFEGILDGSYNPERNAQAEARGVRAGGLAHRKLEDRRVEVRRYVSTVPRGFWQALTMQRPQTSVDQFVYGTAERKNAANRTLRDVLRGRSDQEQKRREGGVFYRFFGGS